MNFIKSINYFVIKKQVSSVQSSKYFWCIKKAYYTYYNKTRFFIN